VTRDDPNTMAFVGSWQPCTIYLNRDAPWGGRGRDAWWKLCPIVIHEYGHVVGRGHSPRPSSIMAPGVDIWRLGATWWPYFPDCRYDGDDEDGDGSPDW